MRKEFDYTMMSTFQTCQRKYYFRMVRNLVGKKTQTAPEFGKCIHSALDVWFSTRDINTTVRVFKESFVENPDDTKRTLVMGEWILRNYAEKYAAEPFKVIATEQTFELDLPNGNKHTGRIDKIIDWDGAIYVMDHKTTSQLGPQFFNKFKPNLQMSGYVWAARRLGFTNCSGILVDGILVASGLLEASRRARLTPLARDISTRSEEELKEWEHTVLEIHDDIGECEGSGVWTPNFDACCDYGECPYRRICVEDGEVREKVIGMDFIKEEWNPLKKEVASDTIG